MKPTAVLTITLTLLTGASLSVYAETQQATATSIDLTPWQKQVLSELRQVQIQLYEHRLECQQEKMPQLERELLGLEQERKRLQSDAVADQTRMSSINEQLNAPALGEAERRQLELLRSDVVRSAQERQASEQADLGKREADVRGRLQAEQRRLHNLKQKAAEIAAQAVR